MSVRLRKQKRNWSPSRAYFLQAPNCAPVFYLSCWQWEAQAQITEDPRKASPRRLAPAPTEPFLGWPTVEFTS